MSIFKAITTIVSTPIRCLGELGKGKKMTDLTEKCKKGKLPEGLYWVKHDGVINILDELEIALTDVEQILGEVPSYEQWQAKLEENTQLKELLKECKHIMSIEKDFASFYFEKDKLCKLLNKINSFIGESEKYKNRGKNVRSHFSK